MSDNTSGGGGSGGGGDRARASGLVRAVLARRARLAASRRESARRRARSTCRRSSPVPTSSTAAPRTVRVPVRMLEHYHFRLRASNEQQGVGPGPGQARRSLGQPAARAATTARPGRPRRGRESSYMLEFKIDDIVDWLWEEMQLPNLEGAGRPVRGRRLDARRLGPARRPLAARPPPLVEGDRSSGAACRARAPIAHVHRRRPALSGSSRSASSRRCRPSCSSCWTCPAACRERDGKLAKTFFFWVVQGLRREYRSAGDGVRRAHHRGLGIQRGGILPGERHRRHRRVDRPEEGARDHRRALQPGPLQHLSVLRLRRRQLPVAISRRRSAALEELVGDCMLHRLSSRSRRARAAARRPRPAGCSPSSRAMRIAVGSYALNDYRRHLGRRAAFLRPSLQERESSHERRLAIVRAPHRGARARARASNYHPRRFRGRAGQLHDGDRRLRSAGAHAALVVRRALHLSADPAPHGPSRGCSRSCSRAIPAAPISRRATALAENMLVTAHVLGHADFSREQHAVPALPGAGQRAHRRAGGGACAPDRQAIEEHGMERVEQVLDAALALEQHIDVDQGAAPRALSGV